MFRLLCLLSHCDDLALVRIVRLYISLILSALSQALDILMNVCVALETDVIDCEILGEYHNLSDLHLG